jgi:hypothetical protein
MIPVKRGKGLKVFISMISFHWSATDNYLPVYSTKPPERQIKTILCPTNACKCPTAARVGKSRLIQNWFSLRMSYLNKN